MIERFKKSSEVCSINKQKILEKNLPSFHPHIAKRRYASPEYRDSPYKRGNPQQYVVAQNQKSLPTRESEHDPKTPRVLTKSFLDLSTTMEQVPDLFDSSVNFRYSTPKKSIIGKMQTSKIQEVVYTPAMEFIVKKVTVQKVRG